ncbi:MAG: AI-2E family transporter [Eubacteriales bacterium]
MDTPKNKKQWQIATISLTVIVLGILFYFFTVNIPTVVQFFRTVNEVLRPIYYGMVLTFLLVPIYNFFYKKLDTLITLKKHQVALVNSLSIFISLFLAFSLVYLLLAMVLPELYRTIEGMIQSIPSDFRFDTPEWLNNFFEENPKLYKNIAPFYEGAVVGINNFYETEILPLVSSIENFTSFAQSTLLPHLSGVVSGVSQFVFTIVGFIFDLVVAIIVSIYLLTRKKIFAAQGKKLIYAFFSVKAADFILGEIRNSYRILSGFFIGKMIDSMIIGVICFIGLSLLNMPFASLVATVIGVTNVIPYFGPFIGAIPCGVLIFFVSPIKCLYFSGFIIALQQFDGNILGPKILGESTGLSSFWVLFSIILFGGIFGFAGMIFGVPVFATLYSMFSRLVKFLLAKKGMPEDTTAYVPYWEAFGDEASAKEKALEEAVSKLKE